MQIYVKDDAGVTDVQILTVQVTDVNEPPQFQGSLAQGETYPGSGIREDPAGHSQTEGKKRKRTSSCFCREGSCLTSREKWDVFLSACPVETPSSF